MGRFLARRVIDLLITILGVSTLTFVILRLTGDPVDFMLPPEATPQMAAEVRRQLGLDAPLVEQYGRFMWGAMRGDLGVSFRYREPAVALVHRAIGPTLALALVSIVVAVAVAVPLGIIAAVRRNTIVDKAAMLLTMFGQSMPFFWLGIMLIIVFAVNRQWLPTSGSGTAAHYVLPTITLASYAMARFARLTRSSMLDVLNQDYMRTARSKGLSPSAVVLRHGLRNAAIPVVTLIGLHFGILMGGAVVTETIFAWPGLGRLVITSIYLRDYPVVQAGVLYMAVVFVLVNSLLDVSYWALDPTIRRE